MTKEAVDQNGRAIYDDAERERIEHIIHQIKLFLSLQRLPARVAVPALMLTTADALIESSINESDEHILGEFKTCLVQARINAAGETRRA